MGVEADDFLDLLVVDLRDEEGVVGDLHFVGDFEAEGLDCVRVSDKDVCLDVLVAFFVHVVGYIIERLWLCLPRHRQQQRHKRIKRYRYPLALRAEQRRLILPMKQINNYRVIPHQVLLPRLLARHIIRLSLRLSQFHKWLLLFLSVEVFAEQVEDRVDAFVGVLLAGAGELLCLLAEDFSEHVWLDDVGVLVPHVAD